MSSIWQETARSICVFDQLNLRLILAQIAFSCQGGFIAGVPAEIQL
jgi:hypothetical protein